MPSICVHLSACIYCFFPLFSPVDFGSDAATVTDYTDDDPSFFSRATRQANPLDHHISPSLFSLTLALEMPCYYCSDSTYSDA